MKQQLIGFLFYITLSSSICEAQEKIDAGNAKDEIIQATPNGKVENGYYICDRFNWKILISNEFQIMDPKRMEVLEKKGYEVLKTEVPAGTHINPHPTHLIGFELNKFNYFSASIEPIGNVKTTIQEHKAFAKKLLEDGYQNLTGLKVEISARDVKLRDYDSYKITVYIYNAKTDLLLLTQEIYNTFIGTDLFSASINYTNTNVGNVLTYNFLNSFK